MKKHFTIRSLNILLEGLVGPRLIEQWWRSPNKAFDGKTPLEVYEGSFEGKERVTAYLCKFAFGEGY
jgi:Protein of unknown function (DUF2384)